MSPCQGDMGGISLPKKAINQRLRDALLCGWHNMKPVARPCDLEVSNKNTASVSNVDRHAFFERSPLHLRRRGTATHLEEESTAVFDARIGIFHRQVRSYM